jgi:hypothetical protein
MVFFRTMKNIGILPFCKGAKATRKLLKPASTAASGFALARSNCPD